MEVVSAMKRILGGVDGSDSSLDALMWAGDLARRSGMDLLAVRVLHVEEAELPPEQLRSLEAGHLEQLVESCRAIGVEDVAGRHLVLEGGPPDALLETAAEEGADLLVVGTRGAGGFVNLRLGSVSNHLAHHTTLPLAIVPRSGAAPTEHVVVGVDGSPASTAAVGVAADLAAGLQVPVTAVHAHEPFFEWVPTNDPRSWHRRAEDDVRRWAAPVMQAGVDLEVVVDRDINPVAAIRRVLDEHPGAVAVVGARGVGGFPGLRLGRTPQQLLHHTGHALVIVPA